eukprot:COSAG04_NODE_9612_length_847_cov_7.433155_2_plen_103_part_00
MLVGIRSAHAAELEAVQSARRESETSLRTAHSEALEAAGRQWAAGKDELQSEREAALAEEVGALRAAAVAEEEERQREREQHAQVRKTVLVDHISADNVAVI